MWASSFETSFFLLVLHCLAPHFIFSATTESCGVLTNNVKDVRDLCDSILEINDKKTKKKSEKNRDEYLTTSFRVGDSDVVWSGFGFSYFIKLGALVFLYSNSKPNYNHRPRKKNHLLSWDIFNSEFNGFCLFFIFLCICRQRGSIDTRILCAVYISTFFLFLFIFCCCCCCCAWKKCVTKAFCIYPYYHKKG